MFLDEAHRNIAYTRHKIFVILDHWSRCILVVPVEVEVEVEVEDGDSREDRNSTDNAEEDEGEAEPELEDGNTDLDDSRMMGVGRNIESNFGARMKDNVRVDSIGGGGRTCWPDGNSISMRHLELIISVDIILCYLCT